MIIERIRGLGQVIAAHEVQQTIQVAIDEMRHELADEMSEKQFVNREAGSYHVEIFALSSCVYARVSADVLDSEEADAIREQERINAA